MVFIVVRQTTQWEDEAVVRAQLPDGFDPIIELWSAPFDMPCYIFRDGVEQIVCCDDAWSHGQSQASRPLIAFRTSAPGAEVCPRFPRIPPLYFDQ